VRVYTVGLSDNQRVYGCLLSNGRNTLLGTSEAGDGVIRETVSGRFVAFENAVCGHHEGDCLDAEVRVVDLETGRMRRSQGAGSQASITREILVTSAGDVAWVRAFTTGNFEVRKLTAGGETLVDSSPDVEPASLAIAGSHLYWTRAGTPMTSAVHEGTVGQRDVGAKVAARCSPPKVTTIAANKYVRVYYRGHVGQHKTYACLVRTGRTTSLGTFDDANSRHGITNVTTGGRFAAYQYLDCSTDDCRNSEVRVIDVRSGEVLRSPKAGRGAGGIFGIAVRANGHVAYVRTVGSDAGGRCRPSVCQVHVFDGASDRLLDAGADVVPLSLAAAGDRLYWLNGDVPRTAEF
jgi:hypothetical protein